MSEIAVPLAVALAAGLAAHRVGLPALVGYLGAGVALGAAGYEAGPGLDLVADIGVLLLLFGIGLKLRPRTLARPAVWGGTAIHLGVWTLAVGAVLLGLAALDVPLVRDLDVGQAALVAFALGFSSTVFAVKSLSATNETGSVAGRVAIGSLVMQDVLAVGFLVVAGGMPSPWAVPVVAVVVLGRPVWAWLLERAGHEELLPLVGLVLGLGVGAAAFEAVGVKPDLGALLVGMVLASHPRAPELAAVLLGLTDLLLVGFFLSIGLVGVPTLDVLGVAAALLLLLPLKSALHLGVFSRFHLRARTTWHATVSLANYSEFGLIVVAVGVAEGLLPEAWATVVAVLVALSFALAAGPNRRRYDLYARWHRPLVRLERHPIAPGDALIDPGEAEVLVFGMGRVGEGAYDEFVLAQEGRVLGVDRSQRKVAAQEAAGRRVIRGDAIDSDFWDRMRLHPETRLAVLAMGEHRANIEAVRRIRANLPDVAVAAIAKYPGEVAELQAAGVTVARNLYEEAGQGLAGDVCAAVPGLRLTGESSAG